MAAAAGLAIGFGAARPAGASPETDEAIAVVRGLIRLEEATAAAYQLAAERGALRGLARRGPRYVREQELRHREVLVRALQKLEGALPLAMQPPAAPVVAEPESPVAIARVALDLEEQSYASYLEAHRTLRGGGLLATLSAIMAAEAQHLAALRIAVNRKPVPNAFDTTGQDASSILGRTP